MGSIELLDCTLRDGGYVNDWEFGHNNIVNLFERLVSSRVDYIELGFLDDRRPYDENRTIMPDTVAVNKIFDGLDKGDSVILGMIDYGTCDVSHIAPANECILDGIRVIFKKHHMTEAIEFCGKIKELGYKVFVQAVSITSYSDDELNRLIGMVNDLHPYAFSLVDTYGLLHKRLLMHYFDIANEKLDIDIRLGYHAHNNFQLAFANCVELMEQEGIKRNLLIDGTLYGMGKSAGNAPLELVAEYMNNNLGKDYNLNQIMEAIDVTILDIYRQVPWGYALKFYVSASHDCHPSYVTYLMNKKKLSMSGINNILNKLEGEKKLLYDEEYVERLYIDYQQIECDDACSYEILGSELKDKPILLVAPGKSIINYKDKIMKYIQEINPVVIPINFIPDGYSLDYIFISNAKRYVQQATGISRLSDSVKLIATSNVTRAKGDFDYIFSYSNLVDEDALIVDNPMIMFIKILDKIRVSSIALAGFDGYEWTELPNYVNANMEHSFSKEKAEMINKDVVNSLKKIGTSIDISFITPTLYEVGD